MRAFEPEFSGKMNFYLSAVDDLLRHPGDAPSIGVILCKTRDATVAEYALRDVNKPIGVSTHITELLTRSLPDNLKNDLPTIEELESEAAGVPFPEEATEKTNGEVVTLQSLMGAVLAVAARECQVVIFTCVPERYVFIGEAAVVPLQQAVYWEGLHVEDSGFCDKAGDFYRH